MPGNSHPSLFIEGDDGTFNIVGIHTTGGSSNRVGVALTKDKLQWIDNFVINKTIL